MQEPAEQEPPFWQVTPEHGSELLLLEHAVNNTVQKRPAVITAVRIIEIVFVFFIG